MTKKRGRAIRQTNVTPRCSGGKGRKGRVDLLVDECLLIELKTVDAIQPIHKAQTLSYMHLLDLPLGLLINFKELVLKSGINRLILPGADEEGDF